MELIDTHCHLDVDAFSQDRAAVLRSAKENSLVSIVVPGIQASTWDDLLSLCETQTELLPAVGLHPVFMSQHEDKDLVLLESKMNRPVVAVGEIGLDYQIDNADRAAQMSLLEAQLVVARDANLPVILHVRKAHDDMLGALKRVSVCGGFVHAFNGSVQQAQHYADFGFCFGFGGMLTFERSTKLRKLAANLPLEQLVLETDAPDMTVMQHRGERNSPAYLPYCLQALTEVRQQEPSEIAQQTTLNARRILRLH